MTRVRRLAVKVTGFVMRHASVGAREWADGVTREVEFIESDWAALGWALGSTRVLLSRRARQQNAVPDAHAKFMSATDYLVNAGTLGMQIIFALDVIHPSSPMERIGASLMLMGWTYWDVTRFLRWSRERQVPPTEDIRATALFRRENLERRLRSARPIRRILPTLMALAYFAGTALKFRAVGISPIFTYLVAAACAFVVRLLWLDTPEKVQTRIARFEETAVERRWME